MYSEDAVFRRTPDMGPDSVLVSVQVGEDRKSPHKYLLNLDASPAIQAASDDEWSSARPTRIGRLMWQKVPGQGLTLVP
jgi:hypothetical protein